MITWACTEWWYCFPTGKFSCLFGLVKNLNWVQHFVVSGKSHYITNQVGLLLLTQHIYCF